MNDTTVKIVSLVVGKEKVTLYHPDGTTTVYDQGDTRVQPILDQALPIIAKRDGSIAEVTIPGMDDDSALYEGVQKKTGRLFRFFKVAVHHVAHIFEEKKPKKALTPEEEQAAHEQACNLVAQLMAQGQTEQEAETNVAASRAAEAQKAADAAAEARAAEHREYTGPLGGGIIPGIPDSELKPASRPGKDETIVAVTQSGRVIPYMEKLRSQFAHVLRYGGEQGLIAFLSRLEAVIDKRGHSVEDVLRFMERGDLPLAEDGMIIAYKLLDTSDRRCRPEHRNSRPGLLFDVHSGKIPQGVGSYVKVDESLVDPNRRNECSNGLHIARRGYLGGFGGDTCVLIKLAPEDVIAVPSYDANKVRVCGYHILFALNSDEFRKVKADEAMTDAEDSQTLLGRAIRGDHTPVIERVEVHGQNGNNVKVVRMLQGLDYQEAIRVALARVTLSSTLVKALAVEQLPNSNERIMSKAAKVAPRALAAKLAETQTSGTETVETVAEAVKPQSNSRAKPGARVIEATRLLGRVLDVHASLTDRQKAATDLKAFKSRAKVGWTVLGCPPDTAVELEKVLKQEPPAPAAAKPTTAKPETSEETILKQVKAGSLSKAEAARKLNTSPRSIDRKLAKLS